MKLISIVIFFLMYSVHNFSNAQSKIYKIENKNGIGYLVGAVHQGTASLYPFDPRLEKIIRATKILTTEVPLNQNNEYRELLFNDLSLSSSEEVVIPIKLLDEGIELLRKHGYPEVLLLQLPHIHPFVTYQLLLGIVPSTGFLVLPGTEAYLETLADRYELQKTDLEDPHSLTLAIKSLSYDENSILLSTAITLITDKVIRSKKFEQADQISNLIKNGEYLTAKKIDEEFMTKYFHWNQNIFDKLYRSRNQELKNQIIKLLNNKEPFFAVVGASHLPEPEGLVDLLVKSG